MKTVKPLLTIGAAFLINIITQYIVDAAGDLMKTENVDVTLTKAELEALKKIDLTEESLKQAVIDNLVKVEQALALKTDENLEQLLTALKAKIKDGKELSETDEGNIKGAVGRAVKAVLKTALSLIGLTPEQLKKALNKDNLDNVKAALDNAEWANLISELKPLLDQGLMDAGLPNPPKVKEPEDPSENDQGLIKAAVDKAVTLVAWKKIGMDADQLKKFAALKMTAVELKGLKWSEAAKPQHKDLNAQTVALEVPENKVAAWKKIGLKKEHLEEFAKLHLVEQFQDMLDEATKAAVTGAAKGAYLSSAVMLAPLAVWFLF